mmetsp:Transcript_104887/g.185292  ORF Transcript_104887/g.185292 Transcript_104887/m.185292 type:complete len:498 (-) Transcript_104887:119-1612(-)
MVRRNGAGGNAASKSRGNGSDNAALRNRIEGFGNAPMPPPVAESFEDRLHNALASDETIGEWYTNARASMDSLATAFDNAVNNIADAIEDTVSAVVGDDDPWEDPAPKGNGQRKQSKKKEAKFDDGERSGVKWDEVVTSIMEGGDLETFVLQVRAQCANIQEEREVADVLAQQLIDSEKTSSTLRVLYIMQAITEGDLPNVRDQIRIKAAAKLEKLQGSATFKALAVQVLGRTATASNSQQNAAESAAKSAPADLLSLHEEAPAAKAKAAPKKEKKQPTDLLDASAEPATTGTTDLLGAVSPAPAVASAPSTQAGAAQKSAKAKSTEPADLLSLGETAPIAAALSIPGLQPPPKSNISPLSAPTNPGLMNLVDLTSTASSAPAPQSDLFPNFAAPQPMNSIPVGAPLLGMSQGSSATVDKRDDGFNPNSKGYCAPAFTPPAFMPKSTPAAAPLKPIIVKSTPASSDPFANLVDMPGASESKESTNKYGVMSMDSMLA